MPEAPLRFVHASDLHFRSGPGRSGTLHDRDEALRTGVLADLRRRRARDGWAADGVLVSGDVAFAGRAEEYAMALAWFAELADAAGCAREAIWTVPGNHDVDRAVIGGSKALRAFRAELRACKREAVDDVLRDWTTSEEASLVFAPLAAYNDFAATFGCRIDATRPYWERPFTLNDGSTLRLRGMTSVLGSDAEDDDEGKRLVVGAMQWGQMPTEGVATLVMCHHPPEWIRDASAFDDALPRRAPVQIFGHMHRQRVRTFDNSLRLFSGAVQPDRAEDGWRPQYNLLTLSVVGAGGGRRLRVEVETRVWAEEADGFVAAPVGNATEAGPRAYELPLDPWTAPAAPVAAGTPDPPAAAAPAPTSGAGRATHAQSAPGAPGGRAVDPVRRLVYRYLTLPHRDRAAVAQVLDLVRDEDDGARDAELVERYFERARLAGRLADVWRVVEQRHADPAPAAENPFAAPPSP